MEPNILSAVVATFDNLRIGKPRPRPLCDLLADIRGGKWRSQVARLRKLRAEDRDSYDREKEKLPTFFVSGNAQSRKTMLAHTGLVQLDLDKCGERLAEIRQAIIRDANTAAAFVSPSGDGLKVVLHVGTIEDDQAHVRAYAAALAHVESVTGHKPDAACKNRNRHCFVSHDPDTYTNGGALPLQWEDGTQKSSRKADAFRNGETPGGEREESSSESKSMPYDLCPKWQAVLSGSLGGAELIAGLEAEKRVTDLLTHEELHFGELWRNLVWRKWMPAPHTRNQWIVERVPFLCRVGGRAFVLKCASLLHKAAAGLFADSIAVHLDRTNAMINATTDTMTKQLSPLEQTVYAQLDERHREAFLILRDCAHTKPDGVFPMSCKELRTRLCLPENKAADRILKTFQRLPLIELIEAGEQYCRGRRPKASTWKWLLSPPPPRAV